MEDTHEHIKMERLGRRRSQEETGRRHLQPQCGLCEGAGGYSSGENEGGFEMRDPQGGAQQPRLQHSQASFESTESRVKKRRRPGGKGTATEPLRCPNCDDLGLGPLEILARHRRTASLKQFIFHDQSLPLWRMLLGN